MCDLSVMQKSCHTFLVLFFMGNLEWKFLIKEKAFYPPSQIVHQLPSSQVTKNIQVATLLNITLLPSQIQTALNKILIIIQQDASLLS